MDLGIRNRVALVTGSHRGTGQVIAQRLATEGVRVLSHGPTADSEPAAGCLGHLWGDLTTDEGAAQVVTQARALCGGVDILINNLGAAEAGQWGELTTADWLASYQLNVLSASRMIDAWLPGMKQQGWGRILQLGTLGTDRPGGSMPHYYAAKGALLTLTLGLAQSLPASGITVNILSPGLILTPEVEASFRRRAQRQGWDGDWSQIEARSVQERHPNLIGRIARRDEVADLALFLVSERASFITGQNIRIDGGALLCSASTTQGQA